MEVVMANPPPMDSEQDDGDYSEGEFLHFL
jgi:hypothetical protein